MKKFKKMLASVFAFALAFSGLSAMPVQAGQDASALEDGTAYLNINKSDWSDFAAEYTNVKITGDGSYTVSMTAAEPVDMGEFNALEVVNGETVLGTGCVITVDSIKINGEEAALQGSSYTCSADGGGVTTRVNLYNEYNSPDDTATAGDDKHADQRVAEGSVMDATATLIEKDARAGVSTLEVAFTVSGFGAQGGAAAAGETPTAEGPAVAHLSINNEGWSEYEAEYVDAEITGDGTYTVSMKAAEGQSLVQFNALEVANGELLLGTAYTITVDSIKINGEEVELLGSSFTCSADGGGINTRVNLYNEWNSPDPTATAGDDNHLDHRVAEGNVEDATATLISSEYINASSGSGFLVESVEVTFTVAGVGSAAAAGEEPASEAPALDLNGEYHAYLGLQTPTYSFRNSFDDATYGRETEYFNQITGWDSENNAVVRPGTFTDAVIAGNGTYTVSVEGMDLSGDFDSQDYFNLIFLSTDIPNTGEITISDIKLDVDGRDVTISPIVSPDSVNYINMLIQNIWNDNVKEIGYYQVPPTAMTITFTVSGFAYDNASASVEAPAAPETPDAAPAATEAPAESGAEGGVSPVVIVIIVVVVIAVIAVVAVVLSKKKKSDK
ncbi:MAG: hypothetical protein NC123_16850 [Butyrivibrio sp.]|nr:hypothetical protein [Acetatifactor muris]MCM1561187.1 hypothetical protein [Butyrivibrio sp.]